MSFNKKYIKDMVDYFNIPSNYKEKIETSTKIAIQEHASNLPTFQGFCAKIGVDRDTFNLWLKEAIDENYKKKDKKEKEEFLKAYKKCREIQESIWIENSLKGLYSQTFAVFVGKNLFGWKDKNEPIKKEDSLHEKKINYQKIKNKVDKMSIDEIDRILLEILKK